MAETIDLPNLVYSCPECRGEMHPQRAGRGGGWGGHGLCILYVCDACQHQLLMESDQSYFWTLFSGVLLLLVGFALAATFSVAPGLIFIIIGCGGLWKGFTSQSRLSVLGTQQDVSPKSVEIEENIFLTKEERTFANIGQRYVVLGVYGVLVVLAVLVVWELIA